LPLLGYEVELLEDLNAKSPPAKFPVYVGGLLFPANGVTTTSALVVQFPLSQLKVEKRSDTKSYTVQADVLLIVKGKDGGVLHRMSRQYDMEGSLEMQENTLKRSFSFCRRVVLPPGDYVLEAVVRDRRTGKVSVKKTDFHVDTNPAEGIRLSSIVLCKESSISARQDSQDAFARGPALEDPLRAAGAPVFPDLSGVFSASSEKEMGIYLVARSRDASAAMKATYDFVRDGVSILKFEQDLPAPDGNGKIRQLAMVDLGKLKPGEYELKVTAGDAQGTASGKAVFLVKK
jgi:hypothetical protein